MVYIYQRCSDHYYRCYRQCDSSVSALWRQLWMQYYSMVYHLYMDRRYGTGSTYIEFGITDQWHNHMCRL